MVAVGSVAKLLSTLYTRRGIWVRKVNPNWYEARELPKTLLCENYKDAQAKADRFERVSKAYSYDGANKKIVRM